jgi:DNA-binding response OmpR family regulator
MVPRVLVIEKAEALARLLRKGLDMRSHAVYSTAQRRALSTIRSFKPDLIILDPRHVPHERALEICRAAHRSSDTPVVVLTPQDRRPDEQLRGAHYLMSSPPYTGIASTVGILLRARRAILGQMSASGGDALVSFGGMELDLEARSLSWRGATEHLTPKEIRLLLAFMMHPGLVLTRGWLMKRIWDTDYTGDTRTLYVHVRWLREKVEADPANPRLLKTVRGVGYVYLPEE